MKVIYNLLKNALPKEKKAVIVEFIAVVGGFRLLESPTLSTDLECMICSGKEHYAPLYDPPKDVRRIWICAKLDCVTTSKRYFVASTSIAPHALREVLWPLFCEINDIGDVNHDVRFEDIQQSKEKIEYLLKFGTNPRGIIIMQGPSGSGKTYASMAVCELYTRMHDFCIFCTQKQMLGKWLETFKKDIYSTYIENVTKCNLLVVDDFGINEASPAFMSFFLDLINSRMQWKNRGTIITTNLPDEVFSNYCREALSDRLNTGQMMFFEEKTRRKPTIL